MKTDVETDAAAYVAILNGPVNGWGQNCCPTTGHQSHVVLHLCEIKHGAAEFNAAVDAVFAAARN